MRAIDLLKDFIHKVKEVKYPISVWLYGDDASIYIRKSVPRLINGRYQVTLDLANIIVGDQGKGIFTRLLEEAEKISPWPIYIECVSDERFKIFLKRKGYKQHLNSDSYYK